MRDFRLPLDCQALQEQIVCAPGLRHQKRREKEGETDRSLFSCGALREGQSLEEEIYIACIARSAQEVTAHNATTGKGLGLDQGRKEERHERFTENPCGGGGGVGGGGGGWSKKKVGKNKGYRNS